MLCEIKLSCECFNTSVTIEGSYLSVWQPVRVQIGNSVAVLVALVAFFRLLAHVRPHFYLKTWCVYAGRHLFSFLCLLANVCHLVFLQLMWSNFKASRQCVSSCEFAMHRRKWWKRNCTVGSCVAFLRHASSSCTFLDYLRLFQCWGMIALLTMAWRWEVAGSVRSGKLPDRSGPASCRTGKCCNLKSSCVVKGKH